jgi:hypothetical protein
MTAAGSASVQAECCGFSLDLSLGFKINFKLPSIKFGPAALSLIVPYLGFSLSCANPTAPVNLAAGIPWGGGRIPNGEPDPDDNENAY